MIILFLVLSSTLRVDTQCLTNQGCGGGGGFQPSYGHHYSRQIAQPLPQLIAQPLPQPQPIEYYYRSNSYAQPPSDTLTSVDKEPASASSSAKTQEEYEEYDKKLPELKQIAVEESTSTSETVAVTPSKTYVREEIYQTHPQPYQPRPYQLQTFQPQPLQPMPYQPYQPRPIAYRPIQVVPAGCEGVQPHYYRPAPYMPRGYALPYAPSPTYPPLPPPPPPPPPPPQPYPGSYIQPPHPMPINDCCGRCSSICGPRAKRVFAKSAKTVTADLSLPSKAQNETDLNDSRCTSKELRDIMGKVSYNTPSIAKRLIQRIAEEKLKGMFAVFCSKEDFTYVTRSKVYCQTERDGVVCYAFQHN
ncbi:unnamed protein product [Haemonchus placei]|uniref:Ground-like domain-containing protein n=1 Tax=Haemonchus placei TaxID=6290 RepID=A0A0N4W4D4_HAEPC|nr:unnamed protein product [Haemonchus placei]